MSRHSPPNEAAPPGPRRLDVEPYLLYERRWRDEVAASLELSGIGNPGVLQAARIAVRHELHAVGENYRDDYALRMNWQVTMPVTQPLYAKLIPARSVPD